jgi:hypothetical protein
VVSFPGAGEYLVILFAQSKTDSKRTDGASLSFLSEGGGDLEYPYLTPRAVLLGAALDTVQGYNPKVAGETEFSLHVSGVVSASLMESAGKSIEGHAFVIANGDLKTIKVSFPGPGSYTVWISAPTSTKANTWEGIASLHYEASGSGRIFPTAYIGEKQQAFQILGPLDGLLKAGQDVTFDVTGPTTSVVVVQSGTTRVLLQGTGGHFKGTARFPAGKLYVFGGPSQASLEGIAEYQVR